MATTSTTKATKASASAKDSEMPSPIDGLLAVKNREIEEFKQEYTFTPADLDYRSLAVATTKTLGGLDFCDLKAEYSDLWASMAIRRNKLPEIDSIVQRIVAHNERYRTVEGLTKVPWFAIAIIHNLEAGGDFSRHLHNGDPLTGRTVHVPAGRPSQGNPPFTWEESASDAMAYDGLTQVTDWSVEHLAYLFERFNGFGYRLYHPQVKSPYLWSYSNQYTSGKYVGDGQWSQTAVSQQCGAMVLLKRLQEAGEIRLDFTKSDVPVVGLQPAAMPIVGEPPTRASMTASRIRPSTPTTWHELTYPSAPLTLDKLTSIATPMMREMRARGAGAEKVLPYDHSIVQQETGFWCGPAATQVLLNARGIVVSEQELALSIGTHSGGTDYVGLIEKDLDHRVPEAGYMSVYLTIDPPTPAQRDRLWRHLVHSIDAGWGVIMNWVAPETNYPQGVKGSRSPQYHGGTVYHYVAAMGYDNTPGAEAVWIADSGFQPFGYWCAFHQVASLIPPKGYTYPEGALQATAGRVEEWVAREPLAVPEIVPRPPAVRSRAARPSEGDQLVAAKADFAGTRWVTGPGITSCVGMDAADLGIMRWDPARNAIAAMFGDNFPNVGMTGWPWYSPSIVMYDSDFNVRGIPTSGNGVAMAPRRQLWDYPHRNPDYDTILPCDFIRVGEWWYVAVMVSQGRLDDHGAQFRTEFWRSHDLVDWWQASGGQPLLKLDHVGNGLPVHPGAGVLTTHRGNTMLTFDQIDNYVYIFGTGGIERREGIWMWRILASEFPRGHWEPWGYDPTRNPPWDWNIPNENTPILEGAYGELCFRHIQGNCVLSYFDALNRCQEAITVRNPWDDWRDTPGRVRYASDGWIYGKPVIPKLYGGYISPMSRLNEPDGMAFFVSQWDGNDNYRVYLVRDTLRAQGELHEGSATELDAATPMIAASTQSRQRSNGHPQRRSGDGGSVRKPMKRGVPKKAVEGAAVAKSVESKAPTKAPTRATARKGQSRAASKAAAR
jgi:lysozyme family protein